RVPRLVRAAADPEQSDAPVLDVSGTVVVTGGTGVLGGLVARHLVVGYGVSDLVLVSRRGVGAPGVGGLVAELEGLGASVRVCAVDVADSVALGGLVEGLGGGVSLVVHVAGVLADATVGGLSVEGLEVVLRPKVDAAWNLHRVFGGGVGLVLFSSVAGVVGGAGQANYAAANACLDGLAAYRRGLGLPGLSLAWGLWEETSAMTAHLGQADVARMARSGVGRMRTDEALALFDAALRANRPLCVPARLDLAALRESAAAGALPAMMRSLVRTPVRRAAVEAPGAASTWATRVAGLPAAERGPAVVGLVLAEVAAVLGHDGSESVDADRAFRDLGFD